MTTLSNKKQYDKYIKKNTIINDNLQFTLNFNVMSTQILQKYEIWLNSQNIFNHMNDDDELETLNDGANGIVKYMKLQNKNSYFYIIMKISKRLNADNIYYEYCAGRCVNIFKTFFPNFIYTFYWVMFNDKIISSIRSPTNMTLKSMKPIKQTQNSVTFLNPDELTTDNISHGCFQNDGAGLLQECVANYILFKDFLVDLNDTNRDTELYNLYFQVYVMLFSLRYNFTHYDLHFGNVLIIALEEPYLIEYNIQIKNEHKKFHITTKYIPVLIDYGRCFFNYENHKSINVIKKFCNTICNKAFLPACDLDAYGISAGYDKSGIPLTNQNFHYINPRVKNESYDLKFLYTTIRDIKKTNAQNMKIIYDIDHHLTSYMFKNIIPSNINTMRVSEHGVMEDTTVEPGKINNLESCFDFLIEKHREIDQTIYNFKPTNMIIIDCAMKRKWMYKKIVGDVV